MSNFPSNPFEDDGDPIEEFEEFLNQIQPEMERTKAPDNHAALVTSVPPARQEATQSSYDPNMTLAPSTLMLGACHVCKTDLAIAAKYCHNCGTPIRVDAIATCRYCQSPLVPDARFCHTCGKPIEALPELVISILENNQIFSLRGDQTVYLVGREVPEQNNFVDVDLGQIGQRKISRQHARLILHDLVWYLEDLGSKGGTRIYNTRLLPNQPTPLEHDMVIYFADIKCKIEIKG